MRAIAAPGQARCATPAHSGCHVQRNPLRQIHKGTHSRCQCVCRVAEKEQAQASSSSAEPTSDVSPLEATIAELAKQAMSADPEAAARMQRYQAAVARLEQAKAAEKELENIMQDALKAAVEEDAAAAANAKARAEQLLADAEVAAAERLMQAAELQLQGALEEKRQLAAAAGRDADRIESGKAAAAAMAGGLAASLPLLLVQSEPGLSGVLTLASSLATCALFGITYRYAVRDDVSDTHLRGGVVAAFGLVKGLGAGDILQAASEQPLSVEVVGPAGLYALQSLVVIGFAAAAVDAAMSNGVVKRISR